MTAALGAVLSFAALVAVITLHGDGRWAGAGWMTFGIVLYVAYRLSEGKPILKRVTIPERALTRRGTAKAEYGSILVPVLGRPLDDDIMQTAGRLSAEENEDEGEGGAVIEAVWVFEVPMAMPLDARIPDEDLKRARKALQRAKAVERSTRASRSPPRPCAPAAPARGSCARPSAAGWRRSCSPPRSPRACAAARCWAVSAACTTRSSARPRATWSTRRPAG